MPVVQCNGANLYYEDRGEGRPIVCLHGAMAGARYFEPQLSGLSAAHRAVAFDFRGHGRSERTEAGHVLSEYARDLRAFLERLDLDDAVLVGWSLGALVSWEYVDQFGTDRLDGLVDVDMEPAPGNWDPEAPGRYDRDRLVEAHAAIQTDHWEFVREIPERLLKDPPSPEHLTMAFDETAGCPPLVKSAIITSATTADYRDVLPAVDVPSLVCAGADEKWRSVAAVRQAADLLPDAAFELFEESGHCPMLEEPERFNRVVGEFVDSL